MAVSPLGGVIYTNQGSPLATQLHQPTMHRPEMIQFFLNQELVEKDKEVEKVTETPDGHGIDPDRENEHSNNEMYEPKHDKKDENEENIEDESDSRAKLGSDGEFHHLDIKV